jgi:hypothetical protein
MGDVVRGNASLLQIEFSPKIQTEVTRPLNTKVVEQVTLYNICKGW